MTDKLRIEDIQKMKAYAVKAGMKPGVVWMSREAYIDLRLSLDPYGIYRQRKLMQAVLPETMIYRGDEWWATE